MEIKEDLSITCSFLSSNKLQTSVEKNERRMEEEWRKNGGRMKEE